LLVGGIKPTNRKTQKKMMVFKFSKDRTFRLFVIPPKNKLFFCFLGLFKHGAPKHPAPVYLCNEGEEKENHKRNERI